MEDRLVDLEVRYTHLEHQYAALPDRLLLPEGDRGATARARRAATPDARPRGSRCQRQAPALLTMRLSMRLSMPALACLALVACGCKADDSPATGMGGAGGGAGRGGAAGSGGAAGGAGNGGATAGDAGSGGAIGGAGRGGATWAARAAVEHRAARAAVEHRAARAAVAQRGAVAGAAAGGNGGAAGAAGRGGAAGGAGRGGDAGSAGRGGARGPRAATAAHRAAAAGQGGASAACPGRSTASRNRPASTSTIPISTTTTKRSTAPRPDIRGTRGRTSASPSPRWTRGPRCVPPPTARAVRLRRQVRPVPRRDATRLPGPARVRAGQHDRHHRVHAARSVLRDWDRQLLLVLRGGNVIVIRHTGVDGVFATRYDHLRRNSVLVRPGDTVRRGQKIAEAGSAGNSTGPHLHFEVWGTGFYELTDPGPDRAARTEAQACGRAILPGTDAQKVVGPVHSLGITVPH